MTVQQTLNLPEDPELLRYVIDCFGHNFVLFELLDSLKDGSCLTRQEAKDMMTGWLTLPGAEENTEKVLKNTDSYLEIAWDELMSRNYANNLCLLDKGDVQTFNSLYYYVKYGAAILRYLVWKGVADYYMPSRHKESYYRTWLRIQNDILSGKALAREQAEEMEGGK